MLLGRMLTYADVCCGCGRQLFMLLGKKLRDAGYVSVVVGYRRCLLYACVTHVLCMRYSCFTHALLMQVSRSRDCLGISVRYGSSAL